MRPERLLTAAIMLVENFWVCVRIGVRPLARNLGRSDPGPNAVSSLQYRRLVALCPRRDRRMSCSSQAAILADCAVRLRQLLCAK